MYWIQFVVAFIVAIAAAAMGRVFINAGQGILSEQTGFWAMLFGNGFVALGVVVIVLAAIYFVKMLINSFSPQAQVR